MPAALYEAWSEHFVKGLAHEYWTPVLLAQLCALTEAVHTGKPVSVAKYLPPLSRGQAAADERRRRFISNRLGDAAEALQRSKGHGGN